MVFGGREKKRLPAEYQGKEASDSREDPITVHIYLAQKNLKYHLICRASSKIFKQVFV